MTPWRLTHSRSRPKDSSSLAHGQSGSRWPIQESRSTNRPPEAERKATADNACAEYLLNQGVRSRIDEAGSPVLDGGDVTATMETLDRKEQQLLTEAVIRLQKLQDLG